MQFVVSVAAGFAFGFIGVELIIGEMDFGARLMLGIFCALVIAVAEIYFLAKKLNEDLDFAEQQQKLLQANKIGFSPPSSDSATKQHSDWNFKFIKWKTWLSKFIDLFNKISAEKERRIIDLFSYFFFIFLHLSSCI